MYKQLLTLMLASLVMDLQINAQNIGIGNTNPLAKLDINGDLILRSYTLTVAEGTTYALDVNTNKFNNYRLVGPTGNFQIAGITAAANDRTITLYNRCGSSLEMYNDDATALVGNRILTGTGGTLAIYNGGSVTLRYDAIAQHWEVVNAHYSNLNYFGGGTFPATAIVMSETEQNTNLQAAGFSLTGSIYIPVSIQSSGIFNWSYPPSTTNAPSIRGEHTAVWTGTQMIIWGGADPYAIVFFNDGKSYSIATNSWQTISSSGLETRSYHSAQWSGTEMLIWGGINNEYTFGNGAKYNPQNNSWLSISNSNAPSSRFNHTSVWTGTEMIIWGGRLAGTIYRTDQKSYNPSSDTWTTISNTGAPVVRINHSAVWTGSKMIIYGGKLTDGTITNTGGIYDPATDSWTAISTTGAPPNGLSEHTAIWTGTEMITYGGRKNGGSSENNFYLYNPDTNTWTQGSTTNKPISTIYHSAIWTGDKMIVYGGIDEIAGIYNPASDSWDTQNIVNNLSFSKHTAIWTGDAMIVTGTAPCQLLKKDFSAPSNQVLYLYKKL